MNAHNEKEHGPLPGIDRSSILVDTVNEAEVPSTVNSIVVGRRAGHNKIDRDFGTTHRIGILILGMHRSGTSALTRVINLLGADLPINLLPPQEDNVTGFWESMDVCRLDDEILESSGLDWHDVREFDRSWFQSSAHDTYKERALEILKQNFKDSSFFVLKDPRFCHLLPFWLEVFSESNIQTKCVLPIRNPLEVAASLEKRDDFSVEMSSLLWLRHVLDAENRSRGLSRAFMTYNELLDDWRSAIGRIAKELGLSWPRRLAEVEEEIDRFLERGYHHHVIDEAAIFEQAEEGFWVKETYSALIKLQEDSESTNAFDKLDDISTEFNRASNTFGAVVQAEKTARENFKAEMSRRISSLNQAVSERDGQIGELNQAVSERDGQIGELNCIITEYRESTSWKLTAPFRWTVHQIKRVRHLLRIASQLMKQYGGIKAVSSKALKIAYQDGLKGIKDRIRNYESKPGVIEGTDEVVDCNDYAEWIRRYDTMTDEKSAVMHKNIEAMRDHPLISVVMPTYNPNPVWLAEAIESVRDQIYPNWELCIADDASTNTEIKPLLEKYAKEDARIKIVFRESNGHISAASNSAIGLATADWITLLDHDDLLPEGALFWVVDAINQNPEAGLIYSDEDKVSETGQRFSPYFKSDWNLDMFYSHNMFSHLGIYRRKLLDKIGGFRVGLEGSQDYDLALRCIEGISSAQIVHIPRVLYHWRVHSGSAAKNADAKPYAMIAGERALNEHFERTRVKGWVESVGFGYRAHYNLPSQLPMVSLIIPTRNNLTLIRQCIESILNKTTYPNYEIIVVDNGSDDPATLDYFASLAGNSKVRVLKDEKDFNFSALNNHAVMQAKGELVGLINNDIEVITPGWLSEMVSHALRPDVGAVGAKLWYPNNTLQHGGVVLGLGEHRCAGHIHHNFPKGSHGYFRKMSLISSFSAVTAACLVIRKDTYELVGGMNEDLKTAYNDVDFCLNVRGAGYRNIWTPYAELYHHESATRGYENTPEKQIRFSKEVQYMKEHWGKVLLHDPAYNPNLTLDYADFSLAWPPRDRRSQPVTITGAPRELSSEENSTLF